MIQINEIGEKEKRFITELYSQVGSNISSQKSMYDIGSKVGLERNEAKQVSENLMGMAYIEVRTLSGGIGLTQTGLEIAQQISEQAKSKFKETVVTLGNTFILNNSQKKSAEELILEIKSIAGRNKLNYDSISDLISDIKTMESQLISSKPKTIVFKECFRSIKNILNVAGEKEIINKIVLLLGE